MSKPRKVRGLLDVLDAEAKGEDWELESPSLDFVPGMGVGATKQATRWAWLGMKAEAAEAIKRALRRPPHRPRKHPYESKDARRAFAIWQMCRYLRDLCQNPNAKLTTRELIRAVQIVENDLGVSPHDQFFNLRDAQNEQSVSRGKRMLDIDENWHSEVCEELWSGFPQAK